MKRLRVLGSILLMMGLALIAPALADLTEDQAKLAGKIAGQLSCVCDTCPHVVVARCGCGQAAKMNQEIKALVAGGKTEQQVYAIFEQNYGAGVRGAPRAEGFNLLAWAMPFAGLILGLAVVIAVVRRLKPPAASAQGEDQTAFHMDERYRKMLERELRE